MKSGITDTATPEQTVVEIPHMTSILRFTTPIDLGRAAQVNRTFRNAADSIVVWQEMIKRYFPYLLNEDEMVHKNPKAFFINRLQSIVTNDVNRFFKMHSLPEVSPSKALVLSSLRGEERVGANRDFISKPFQKLLFILALANGHLLEKLEYECTIQELEYAFLIAAKNGCKQGVQLTLDRKIPFGRDVIILAVKASSVHKDTQLCEMLISLLDEEEKENLFGEGLELEEFPNLALLLLNNSQFDEETLLGALDSLNWTVVNKHILSRMENCTEQTLQALLALFAEYSEHTGRTQQDNLRALLRMPNLQFSAAMIGEALVRVIETFGRANNSFPPEGMLEAILNHPEAKNIPRPIISRAISAAISAGLSLAAVRLIQFFKPLNTYELVEYWKIAAKNGPNLLMIKYLLLHCGKDCFGRYVENRINIVEHVLIAAAIEDYEDIVDKLLTHHRISLSPAIIGKALCMAALNRNQRLVECILKNDLNEITEVDLNLALDHATKNRDKKMETTLLARREEMVAGVFEAGELKSKRPKLN